MEEERYQVEISGKVREYPKGTTYLSIAKEYQKDYESDIVLVFIDGKLQELHKTVKQDCRLRFVTTAEDAGHKTYRRSVSFLLVKAVYDTAGHENIERVRINFSVDKGYYCTIRGQVVLDQSFLEKVEARMRELAAQDLPIQKRSVHTDEATEIFRHHGMKAKEKLFRYRRVSKVNIYSINEFEDYYYGYMVPSTGYLKYFSLHLYNDGFVVQMPTMSAPQTVPPFHPRHKLFQVLKESTQGGDRMGIENVGSLNDFTTSENPQQIILVQEALQEKRIAQIAEQIAAQPEKKFVLIAGPSSSGKTTFSHRLSVQLRVNGLVPHPIAVDNYFVNREDTPLDEEGKLNFECLEAVDVKKFNQDLRELLEGKRVEIPSFNFKIGKREYKGNYKQLGKNDILVIEGIHCLNDKLTAEIAKENKFKIYISALTQLNIDEHNRIPSTDGRLLRRIVRDARTRGTPGRETIAMWKSVRRGEEENIFPYQEEADVMFNSALLYELAVLKQYVEPILFGIDKNCEEYTEAKRLLKFLDYFVGIGSENIPGNSILREFIGGGCFEL
ncbi:MAG: nucleoside kinase [Coprococcus sp.]|nr:nucleoside kinase [Coprococcus sp.]